MLNQDATGVRDGCRVLAALDRELSSDPARARTVMRDAHEAGADGITVGMHGTGSPRAEDIARLVDVADGLDVVVAPYDLTVAGQVSGLRFHGWKVDAALLTHLPLLDEIAAHGRPIIAAVAGCTRGELEDALCRLPEETTLLHTVLATGIVGVCDVAHISALRRYGHPVGYADHGIDVSSALVAVALGAAVVEKPLTVDPAGHALRHRSALLPHEFRTFVDQVRELERVLAGHGARDPKPEELDAIEEGRVSIVASRMIPRGTAIASDMLTFRAPGSGLPPRFVQLVEGKRVLYDIPEGAPVTLGLIEA